LGFLRQAKDYGTKPKGSLGKSTHGSLERMALADPRFGLKHVVTGSGSWKLKVRNGD